MPIVRCETVGTARPERRGEDTHEVRSATAARVLRVNQEKHMSETTDAPAPASEQETPDPQAAQAEALEAAQAQHAAALKAAKDQYLEAMGAAQEQQLEVLAQLRQAATENAQYWEEVAREHAAALGQEHQEAPQTKPTTWVDAHFTYVETVIRAQYDYARALVPDEAEV